MLTEQQLEIVLRLIQLVALVLPANAIILQVLQEAHKQRFDLRSDEFVDEGGVNIQPSVTNFTLRSRASSQADFILAQWSIHLFVFSAFAFIGSLAFHVGLINIQILSAIDMLRIGITLIALGFLFLGISVLFTEPRLWKTTIDLIRGRVSELRE